MKRLAHVALLATTMLATQAFAQTSVPNTAPAEEAAPPTETTPMPADGAQPGAAATTEPSTATADQGGFVTYQEGTQMLASGLMGANVMGADNENIGTVDDLLLSDNGQVEAVIVGVGGFLGVGTKNVAIAVDQLDFAMTENTEAGAGAGAGDTAEPAVPSGSTTMTPATPPAENNSATGGAATSQTGGDGWGWTGAGIDHVTVSYTREQLEAAPEFEAAE